MAAKVRPIHSAAFYEMATALIVLVGILIEAIFQANGLVIRLLMYMMASAATWYSAIAVRLGKDEVPPLTTADIATSDVDCRRIETWMRISIVGTLLGAAAVVSLAGMHRLVGGGVTAAFVFFNIYGWFALTWWREAWATTTTYQRKRKLVAQASGGNTIPTRTVPVAAPQAIPLRIGSSGR